jgi:iron-sulfur cluster insertion protein
MIIITPKAIEHIKQFSKEENIGHLNIRIKCISYGCAGMGWDMMFDDLDPTELDEIIEQDGVKVYIDPFSFNYMTEITLDYIEGEMGSGFKFFGGSEYKSCGCGSSWTI